LQSRAVLIDLSGRQHMGARIAGTLSRDAATTNVLDAMTSHEIALPPPTSNDNTKPSRTILSSRTNHSAQTTSLFLPPYTSSSTSKRTPLGNSQNLYTRMIQPMLRPTDHQSLTIDQETFAAASTRRQGYIDLDATSQLSSRESLL
jgi:hypothetical protein